MSGADSLLPVQLSMFGMPKPQVTPPTFCTTCWAGRGHCSSARQLRGSLARSLVLGSAPGVIIGALPRVYVANDPAAFTLVVAAVPLPSGCSSCDPLAGRVRASFGGGSARQRPGPPLRGRQRRRHLRNRGVDPRTDPRGFGRGRQRGVPGRPRQHVRHLHGRRHRAPSHPIGRSGSPAVWRPLWRLSRRITAASPARTRTPPYVAGTPGRRPRRRQPRPGGNLIRLVVPSRRLVATGLRLDAVNW